MGGDGRREPIAWTVSSTDDAWLVLDRNKNGKIDSAREMFGNFTDQPHASGPPNGFLALAEFDRSDFGGNNDGEIDSRDAAFGSLRLWQDLNRNGLSEPGELHPLLTLEVQGLELTYQESKKTDEYGNRFRYRARVKGGQGKYLGRWAWDVFLSVNPSPRPR